MNRASETTPGPSWKDPFRALFYTSPNGAVVFDQQTLAIVAANDAASKLYGCTQEELMSRSFLDLFAETDREAFAARLKRTNFEAEKSGPWSQNRGAGELLYVELTVQPYLMEERPVVIARIYDVTARIAM